MASTENDTPPLYAGSRPSPITKYTLGSPLGGYSTWSVSGIQVSEQDDILNFLKTGTTSRRSWRQWAGVGWAFPSMSTGQGLVIVYRIRWNNVIGAGELRMSIPSLATISNDESLVLIFRNGEVSWEIYNFKTKLFVQQNSSKITANRKWHDILICVTPGSLRVYEDGRDVLAKTRSGTVSGSFDIVCELDELETFDVDLTGFRTCRIDAHQDKPAVGLQSSTSTGLIFNSESQAFNTQYLTFQGSSCITPTYTENSLRFFTESFYGAHCAGSIKYISALSPYSVIEYCFKVNKFGGEGTKIAMAGGLILGYRYRIPQWQFRTGISGSYAYSSAEYSGNFYEGSPYTRVLAIASPGLLSIFENGKFKLEFALLGATDPDILFEVGHYNTPVDVELSYIRIISGA